MTYDYGIIHGKAIVDNQSPGCPSSWGWSEGIEIVELDLIILVFLYLFGGLRLSR